MNSLFELNVMFFSNKVSPLFSTFKLTFSFLYFTDSIKISEIKLFPKKTMSLCFTSEIKLSFFTIVSPKHIECIGVFKLSEYKGLTPSLYKPSLARIIEERFRLENLLFISLITLLILVYKPLFFSLKSS